MGIKIKKKMEKRYCLIMSVVRVERTLVLNDRTTSDNFKTAASTKTLYPAVITCVCRIPDTANGSWH